MGRSPLLLSDPETERQELVAYLGGDYDESKLRRYERTIEDEFATAADEPTFYRTSFGYLYNLTAFAMTGTKLPYLKALQGLVPVGSRLLDYGCGIGSDGLTLLEEGYRVEFADFDNPSAEYLRWRLERRGLSAPVHDLDRRVPSGFSCAYAFDVIEHVADPFALLSEMEERSEIVMVNLLEASPGDPPIHHALPIARIVNHAIEQRLLFYRVFHRRSHLVAYAPGGTSTAGRVRGRMLRGLARARRAV